MKRFEIIGLLAIVAVTAIVGITCSRISDADKLAGITWVLASYGQAGNLTAVLPDIQVTLIFDKDKGTVSGSGGVNGYGGDYKASGNSLTMSRMLHTLMASSNQSLNTQENQLFSILGSAQSFKLNGIQLTITGTQGVLVFNQK
jgi:heat shock protein HslJ